MNLKGKNALITGAGKGIGKAIAIALAKEGVNVALLARTATDLKKVAEEAATHGVQTVIATADISSLEEVTAAAETVYKTFTSIDILINNAGIGRFGNFLEMPPEDWQQVININLLGTYHVTRTFLANMIAQKSGDIINISSTAGLKGAAVTSAYSASKFGVIGLTESLMQEVRKHNIRVTALTPSTVATDMALDLNLTDGNPEKVMQPEDIAELVLAHLQLNRRVFINTAGIWSTNP
ncbi:3-ketoacyl-ACP reductase [Aquimarina sp. TRL1]|uniref:3-ketoacyl-ACP reductase n=1 Tax=Aquimarina sp. (strain TRL1) TaxID=2736252 RepID=UPI0015891F11|nr:3-ketoacyl-ACP reductase [Aquimarina sp. TRL1]QKX05726.1 3-ketoacyl-ACP reductase [Aquimarina sp. TRL1]